MKSGALGIHHVLRKGAGRLCRQGCLWGAASFGMRLYARGCELFPAGMLAQGVCSQTWRASPWPATLGTEQRDLPAE